MPCFPSLAHAEKNSSALQRRWLEEPEGFPTHVSFRKGNKRVVTPLRMANKTAIMAAARETKGHYGRRTANRRGVTPRGCETPSAPPGLVPLRGGTVHSCRL